MKRQLVAGIAAVAAVIALTAGGAMPGNAETNSMEPATGSPMMTTSATTGCDGAVVRTPAPSVQGNAKALAKALGTGPGNRLVARAASKHFRWLTTMTCKARPDRTRPLPSRATVNNTIAKASGEATDNWAGSVVTSDPNANHVEMAWTIPTLSYAPWNGNPPEYSSIWPGLGGWNGEAGNLAQTGSEQDASCPIPGSCQFSYYLWWELWPQNYQQEITNMPTSAGDRIMAYVNTYTDGLMDFEVCSDILSSCLGFSATSTSSPAAGHTADFIVERTTEDGNLYPVPDFGTVALEGTLYDHDLGSTSTDGSANGFNVDIYNGNNQLTSSSVPNTALYQTNVSWLAPN